MSLGYRPNPSRTSTVFFVVWPFHSPADTDPGRVSGACWPAAEGCYERTGGKVVAGGHRDDVGKAEVLRAADCTSEIDGGVISIVFL